VDWTGGRWAAWAETLAAVGVASWLLARLLGPFRLEGNESPANSSRRARVGAWFTGWRIRPRATLGVRDWWPHGRMFLPAFVAAGLVYGGLWVLFGPGQTFRLGGALALLGAALLALVIVGHVQRPVETGPIRSVGSRFPLARPGYRVDDVNALFDRLPGMSRGDIEAVRFRSARVGYDESAVDRALDEAADASIK
jgi:DivIVA domain-containing protein